MHDRLEAEFKTLLILWRRHDELRKAGASVPALASSGHKLEMARSRVWTLRRATAPREDELADAYDTVVCPELATLVAIPWQETVRVGESMVWRCICGQTFESAQSSSLSGS